MRHIFQISVRIILPCIVHFLGICVAVPTKHRSHETLHVADILRPDGRSEIVPMAQ